MNDSASAGSNDPSPDDPSLTGPGLKDGALTDFGYRQVPAREKGARVRAVFDSVASNYDVMNDLMSFGVHRLWKREFIAALEPSPERTLLDLAAGTGDIGFGWLRAGGGSAILTDVNASMLAQARRGSWRTAGRYPSSLGASFVLADAEALPLAERSVDRVSIAFGLRNCTDKDRVLAEARRVLKPGGRFLCLEFSRVRVAALTRVYDAWSFGALPLLGRVVARDAESYRYLAESIRMFPDQERLAAMMRAAGFARVSRRRPDMPRWIRRLFASSRRTRMYLPRRRKESTRRPVREAARPGGIGQRRSARLTAAPSTTRPSRRTRSARMTVSTSGSSGMGDVRITLPR